MGYAGGIFLLHFIAMLMEVIEIKPKRNVKHFYQVV